MQQLSVKGPSPQPRSLAAATAHANPDVQSLQEHVRSLQNLLRQRDQPARVRSTPTRQNINFYQTPNRVEPPATFSYGSAVFCYRCGEDGHIATKSANPENSSKVIRRLVQSMQMLQRSQREVTENTSKRTDGQVTVSQVGHSEPRHLPTGLIGTPTVGRVIIEGQCCDALMDSGSTVSIIFEEWYFKHLSHLPLHPIASLDLWGLGQSSYPYKGFISSDAVS